MEKLLIDMLNLDTQNPPGNERILAEYIAGCLADAPVETAIQPVADNRANVIARLVGKTSAGTLVINGHLDTVPSGGGWSTDPLTPVIRDGRVYARGASDMKSGLAAMLFAFRRYALSGAIPPRDIIFAGTCDEESKGLGASALMELPFMKDVSDIVIGEPTGNMLGLASKGCLWLRARVRGRTSHGAYPERGVNAIYWAYEFAKAVEGLLGDASHPLLGPATATITGISGGVKANMVPDEAMILFDIRTLPSQNNEDFVAGARGLANKMELSTPGLKIDLSIENDRAPMETGADRPIARHLARSIEKVTGQACALTGSAFFSDASIFLKHRAYDVVLFGPGESACAHTPDESVSLTAYKDACEAYFTLLKADLYTAY